MYEYQASNRRPKTQPRLPAETLAPSPTKEDTSWWEGPLDQVLGRKVDGKISFQDATRMDLAEVNKLAKR